MKEINLYIDESGNLGHGMGRFFLICALDIDSQNLKSINKRAGRIINRFKKKYGYPRSKEIKGWQLKEHERTELLTKILLRDVKVRYIVLDLNKATFLLTKADDKNACYNYLIQLLIKEIVSKAREPLKINLNLDNRTVKIGHRLALKPYLYNKFVFEQLEHNKKIKKFEFVINYLESKHSYLIEWADIMANSLYKKYNSDIDIFYKIIKPYIIYESKFPSRRFGK